jgi:restriction system protein
MPNPTPVSVLPILLKGFEGTIPLFVNSIVSRWWLWGTILIFIIALFGYRIYLYFKLSKSGISEIDKLSGEEFEERLKILFFHLGYQVERTSMGKVKPDYGADLVIEKDGVRTAVQAKRYGQELVGENAVREAFSAKNYYHCTESMVVTTSFFSKIAKTLAKSDNVKLWDRNELIHALLLEKSTL